MKTRQSASDNDAPHLYVLDESSLASTKNLYKFFARIGTEDRVLLVGDARQHQAVEAGSPFEQFQRAGMETARLSEIVRQKDPRLKEVVELLAKGEVIEHRDEVHQDLLAVLDLKDRERKNLSERGMSNEAASENNYKSVPSRIMADAVAEGLAEYHDLRGVPGFYREEGKDAEPGAWRLNVNYWHQGLMVPVRDVEGRIKGFQIRRAESQRRLASLRVAVEQQQT